MNAARHASLLNGQSAIARKVFDVVPISGKWGLHAIAAEMARTGQSPPSLNVLGGCLGALHDAGLIVGSHNEGYSRSPVHERKPKPVKQHLEVVASEKSEPDVLTAMEALAGRVKRAIDELHAIAGDMEAVALRVAQQMDEKSEDTKKLDQLRSLLKGLT